MCKRYTTESWFTKPGQLEDIQDFRVYSYTKPDGPVNIYKACLAGIRRQRY